MWCARSRPPPSLPHPALFPLSSLVLSLCRGVVFTIHCHCQPTVWCVSVRETFGIITTCSQKPIRYRGQYTRTRVCVHTPHTQHRAPTHTLSRARPLHGLHLQYCVLVLPPAVTRSVLHVPTESATVRVWLCVSSLCVGHRECAIFQIIYISTRLRGANAGHTAMYKP